MKLMVIFIGVAPALHIHEAWCRDQSANMISASTVGPTPSFFMVAIQQPGIRSQIATMYSAM